MPTGGTGGNRPLRRTVRGRIERVQPDAATLDRYPRHAGARVGVPVKGAYVWTAGTDEKYLADITTSKLKYSKGW
jgi:hypothetical protein